MMRIAFLITGLFILFDPTFAQQIDLKQTEPVTTIPLKTKIQAIDKIGNIYLVTTTNQLYKYNAAGKRLSTLNFNYSGNITSIDVTNPLEIYVFYQELNRVVFLDNNLAYRGSIDLTNFGINMAFAVARTYENGIWVFDAGDLMLKKLDKEGNIKQTSGNIRQYINSGFKPQTIFDDGMNVFVCDSAMGILLFDVFADYKKYFELRAAFTGALKDKFIICSQGSLETYQIKPFKLISKISLPENAGCAATEKQIALSLPEKVMIYQLSE